MNNNLKTTKDQETMKTSPNEKNNSPLTNSPANGSEYDCLCDADGRELSVMWVSVMKGVAYRGTVRGKKRFEIMAGTYSYSLYDLALPLGFQFIDDYPTFADATEASLELLVMEAARAERETARKTARAALIHLELIHA